MKIDKNTLKLVRALVKLTSVITDIDELRDCKEYKFQLKKDLNDWSSWLEENTNESMIKLTTANDGILMDLINMYNNFENDFYAKNDFVTRLLLIIAKCNSALRDIDTMDPPYNQYVGGLRAKVAVIVNKKYLNAYISYCPDEFNKLLNNMNKLSDEVIVGT